MLGHGGCWHGWARAVLAASALTRSCLLLARTILLSVISLLNEPNTFSPANVDASVMYRKWKESKGKDREYTDIIRCVLSWAQALRCVLQGRSSASLSRWQDPEGVSCPTESRLRAGRRGGFWL